MYWGETEIKYACTMAGMSLEQIEAVIAKLPRGENATLEVLENLRAQMLAKYG